jgi:hypothetical protein
MKTMLKNISLSLLLCFGLLPILTVAAPDPLPTSSVATEFFYQISGANGRVWIAPPTWKVLRDTAVPTADNAGVMVSAAQNEYEPVQVVVRPASGGNANLNIGATWTGGPSGNVIQATVHQVSYVKITTISGGVGNSDQLGATGDWPDPLYPIAFGENIPVTANQNQPFWLTIYVPATAAAGDYTNTLTVTYPGGSTSIPITVHVFNFQIPPQIHFESSVNASYDALGGDARRDAIKKFWYDHRMTPASVTWPSGFNWGIVWDNGGKPVRCAGFIDESDSEPNENYQAGVLANRYVAGNTTNLGALFQNVGFPVFESMRFVNNSTPRPSTFCGKARGSSHYGTDAYNTAWRGYLSALNNYFVTQGYQNKAYYYVQNEPQDDSDYQLAAYLAKMTKEAAPNLKIMISEEAKEEIYNNPTYPGYGYDIWVAHLIAYNSAVNQAWDRLKNHGEHTWWYSLVMIGCRLLIRLKSITLRSKAGS